ncbi:hypothetical protein B0H19DRAFT_1373576 [Mycena capillaripes]|nr:hypothetical protein B0H19DRAFT_1373576 [Mycena capillaripes]
MKSRSRKLPATNASPSLPDEIVSEILSPALKVSDEIFSDNGSEASPFAKYEESSSAFLLVCKAWLRVATPLLYNVVVLRSKAQAKALSQALTQNEELGQFIKKLRVEGGYGTPMRKILECSPNITDIFLSLDITAADGTTGLCDGLPLINPTCVILRYIAHRYLANKMIENLFGTLAECLSKWDNLRTIDLPPRLMGTSRCQLILDGLKDSVNLHTVIIPEPDYRDASWAADFFKLSSLQIIQIKGPRLALPYYYSFVNLRHSSAIPDFSNILQKHPTIGSEVRAIFGWLGRPMHPDPMEFILSQTTRLEKFHHSHAPYNHASVSSSYYQAGYSTTRLDMSLLSMLAFEAMAKSSGSTLRQFSQEVDGGTFYSLPPVFSNFTQLTSLDWKCRAKFHLDPKTVPCKDGLKNLTDLRIWDLDPSFLNMLDSMECDQRRFNFHSPDFFIIRLPSLRRLTLSDKVVDATAFLQSFGSTLSELDLAHDTLRNLDVNVFVLCPNLTFLSVYFTCEYEGSIPHVTDFVLDETVHHHLAKVNFDLETLNKRHIDNWDAVFEVFGPPHFPNLRDIQVQACGWPMTEREITKSVWVRWAQRSLKHGVNMMDKDGKRWRARLKSGRH